mmetsp:Transcript_6119/g.7760  ORF Transcript_6119/g.7760 Transcript_6119/m.7760 type:complete len:170 (+) Transcript_6119:94-603(+)
MNPQNTNHLPDLPLTCLKSAEFKKSSDAFEGKNVVIDFWTTKCERCPDALDNLNNLAALPEYSNVKFTSIVLDECDGARNIIETPSDEPRWNNMQHFYMDKELKEQTKSRLGMKQVPFYVVLNNRGEIVQKGSKKQVDFDDIPGMEKVEEETKEEALSPERMFCLDEDF